MPENNQIKVVIFEDACFHEEQWDQFDIETAKQWMDYDEKLGDPHVYDYSIDVTQIDSGLIHISVPEGSTYIFVARPD